MKTILCSVMDGKYIKEYELTYNEEEMNSFFEELYYTNIIPVTYESSDCYRVQRQIWQAENFDKMNTLKDQNDIKEYIYRLHESSMMDLTQLAILMKSNGAMRSNQVREIFRNYLNLYNYSEISCYDSRDLSMIIRKMYEFRENFRVPNTNPHIVEMNTYALDEIGFSIENKIERQKQKVIGK